MSDVPIVVEVTPLPDIVVEVPVYGTAPGDSGLHSAYGVPIVAGVADVAAGVALGYSTIEIRVTAETDVDVVLPDPETTDPFDLVFVDPTGVCNLTFSGGTFLPALMSVDLNSDPTGIWYWWRVQPWLADPDVVWTLIPQFGADQLGGTVDFVSNVATSTILGRTTAGSGDSEELTPSATMGLLSGSAAADFSLNSHKLTGVSPGTASTDGVNLSQLDNTGFAGVSVDAPPGPNYWSYQSALATTSAPSSEMYLFPFTWRGLTLARLAMRCDTAEAGSEARLGIWDITGISRGSISSGAGTLLEDVGLVSGAATGWVRATPTYGLLDHGSPPLGLSVSFSTHTNVRWKRITHFYNSPLGFHTGYNEGYFGWRATGVSHMSGLPSTLPAMTMYSDAGVSARTPFVGPEFT